MIQNLPVKYKILLGFTAVFIVVVLTGGITFVIWLSIYRHANVILRQTDRAQAAGVNIARLLADSTRTIEEVAVGFEPMTEASEEFEYDTQQIHENENILRNSVKGGFVNEEEYKDLHNNIARLEETHKKILALLINNQNIRVSPSNKKSIDPTLLALLDENDEFFEDSMKSVDQITRSLHTNYEHEISTIASHIRLILFIVLICFAVFITVGFFALFFLSRYFTRRINKIIVVSEKVSKGDLNVKVDITSRDEFGKMGAFFNEMISNLKFSYDQIKDANLKTQLKSLDLEKQNLYLEDMGKAMLNILEDERETENELKDQKKNIENIVQERTQDLESKTIALENAKNEISKGWIKLQEEKARLIASINSLPAGFILTDRHGEFVVSNMNVEKILGKEGNLNVGLIQKKLGKSFDLLKLLNNTFKSGKTHEIKELNFGEKVLKVLILPIMIENTTEPIGAAILLEDITEAKILERSKDEFFSIASHELRTPLTSIRGNTSLIQQYYGDKLVDKSLKEMIQDIYDSSTRLIEIVNDFLDISRIEQGRLEYKIAPFDAQEVVEKIVDELQNSSGQKGITLTFEKSEKKLPHALADIDRVKQITYNLIGNSIKYTDKGSATVWLQSNASKLELRVKDTGRGIPIESQSLLFRKFQQASNNLFTRDTTRGTGLGLYISKMLANGMKGDLVLEESQAGKGSTFLLTIPIAK